MIITFKQYPELGRLKVVEDTPGRAGCVPCLLSHIPGFHACPQQHRQDDDVSACLVGNHHYEPAPPRTKHITTK